MTTALLDTLSPEQLTVLRTKLETASVSEQQAIVAALGEQARARCAEDILFWLQFVKTRDEADASAQGIKPFPVHKEYMRRLIQVFVEKQKVVVAKSRQVMASWATCAFMVWTARFHPHRLVIYQTQNWDDSVKMTAMPGASKDGGFAGRCQLIEQNLPSWLQQNITYSEGRVMYPNGSLIESLPGGASKIRGKTPSLVVLDEFAYFLESRATLTAVLPLVQKGAKVVCLSTPQGAEGSTFFHIWSGLPFGQAA